MKTGTVCIPLAAGQAAHALLDCASDCGNCCGCAILLEPCCCSPASWSAFVTGLLQEHARPPAPTSFMDPPYISLATACTEQESCKVRSGIAHAKYLRIPLRAMVAGALDQPGGTPSLSRHVETHFSILWWSFPASWQTVNAGPLQLPIGAPAQTWTCFPLLPQLTLWYSGSTSKNHSGFVVAGLLQ